ncbi:AMIN domain-containing protein [Nostocaceae cyanobacterium CENA369]|uniref:AMIN domain-containing protein n=1 Tax=Dendronalium phyllosphericum CENA369 TaxID=1725256 RepID=A0A8J7LG12_9NOST|nr:AMIN domain-containing protein [Dendronalium phyllosphericum]MBH8576517.1 AMIN domain-containing protein [Dendronalium phyllosphericum CENA369]
MYKKLKTRQFFQCSKQLLRFSLFGFYTTIALETSISIAAPVAKLNDWRFSPEALQLEIILSAGAVPRYFYLSQPARLVVDLPDTKLGHVPTQKNYSGAIQRIRVSQLNATVTRIVLDLAAGTSIDPKQIQLKPVSRKNSTRWVLRHLISSSSRSSTQPGNSQPSPNNPQPNPDNYYPQLPTNTPPSWNYPQTSNPAPSNYLQLPSTLPATTNQQPFVTVPPLAPSSSSQLPSSILPPPAFPYQPSNFPNTPPTTSPDFPIPTIPNNYPTPKEQNVEVIEFGQPLPKH